MFTVKHLVQSFEAEQRLLVKAGVCEATTARWYADHLKQLDALGDFPADALRTCHLAAVPFTNGFVRALKRLYKWAAEEHLVGRDPFAKLDIPPCGKRERTLARSEMARLYLATNRPFRRLLFVQAQTMARPGEIRNLTWGQVDWSNRVLVLTKFKAQKRRKDQARCRLIPLSKPALRVLKNMHRKSPDPSPAGRVFRSARYNAPWTPNGVRCAFREARKRAGLDGGEGGERVVCYTLRHTAATEAIRADVNIKVVAEMMGHTRTSTTERYLHLNTADMLKGIDQVTARRPRSRPAGPPPADVAPPPPAG